MQKLEVVKALSLSLSLKGPSSCISYSTHSNVHNYVELEGLPLEVLANASKFYHDR
jgi:hypothetical protein